MGHVPRPRIRTAAPPGTCVALRLVRSKTGDLEEHDTIRPRIDEAAPFPPPDQLCLSIHCGFASTQDGNTLAEAEQWAKLSMTVDVAAEVWG